MRTFALILALCAAALSAAQTRMSISANGHPAGYATLSQRLQPDGVKVVELRLELTAQKTTVKIVSEARYDAKGMPLRKFQQTTVVGSPQTKQVVATFTKDGANVVQLDGEKRTVKDVSLASTAPRLNPSEFWFIRDTPKQGQVEETYQFSPDSLEWELVHTEYRGKKMLKIEGHTVTVHEVYSKRGDRDTTSYLDDQGLPVLIDQGDVKMVKIWPK